MKAHVSEIFRSIEGEGQYIGFPTVFVRLTGCNLRCKWCDTKYALEGGEYLKVTELIRRVSEIKKEGDIISFTGGEPLLQQEVIEEFIKLNEENNFYIIETNGTIIPSGFLKGSAFFEISPKLKNSGQSISYDLSWVSSLLGHYHIKFVVLEEKDFDEIDELVEKFKLEKEKISIQPNGLVSDYNGEMLKVVEWCKERGYRFVPQLHRILWGLKRGV
jgi:7-carboxy-7-deazaguanine synthase